MIIYTVTAELYYLLPVPFRSSVALNCTLQLVVQLKRKLGSKTLNHGESYINIPFVM